MNVPDYIGVSLVSAAGSLSFWLMLILPKNGIIRRLLEQTAPASTPRLVARPALPIPSHVQERRIIPTYTKIWVNDYGQYHIGSILGYSKEPTRGAYYHVSSRVFNANGGNGTRWVPDSFVWESEEVIGDVVAAEAQ